MLPPGIIYVRTEEEIIRAMLDIANVNKPEDNRIKDTEYQFFEGLIYAQGILGTIATPAAEAKVKEFLDKPKMSRKSFLTYMNSLATKGWIDITKSGHKMFRAFDLYKKAFPKKGVLCSFMVERIEEEISNGTLEEQNT